MAGDMPEFDSDVAPAKKAPAKAALREAWKSHPDHKKDPFKAAVAAASDLKLPSRTIQDKDYPLKSKTYYQDNEDEIQVTYHASQRFTSLSQGRIFEHVFDARKARASQNAIPFNTLEEVRKLVIQQHPKDPRPGFVWLMSRERFSLGWVEDQLEFGIGHLNLIDKKEESVHFAGELSFDLKANNIKFNFMSGMFTLPMLQAYQEETGQEFDVLQGIWETLFTEVFKLGGNAGECVRGETQITTAEPDKAIDFNSNTTVRRFRAHPFCTGPMWVRQCVCHLSAKGPLRELHNYCLPPHKQADGKIAYTKCDKTKCQPNMFLEPSTWPLPATITSNSSIDKYFPEAIIAAKTS